MKHAEPTPAHGRDAETIPFFLRNEADTLRAEGRGEPALLDDAADEIERLRYERDVATASLGIYKRSYVRAKCAPYYTSGAMWKTQGDPARSSRVFVVEDCENAYESRTVNAFPHRFELDIADEIVELLNRATRELNAPSSIPS